MRDRNAEDLSGTIMLGRVRVELAVPKEAI